MLEHWVKKKKLNQKEKTCGVRSYLFLLLRVDIEGYFMLCNLCLVALWVLLNVYSTLIVVLLWAYIFVFF